VQVQRLRDLSVRGKLGAGFGLVLALAVILGVVMLSELGRVHSGGEYLGRTALPHATAINLVGRDAVDLRRAQLKYVLDPLTPAGTQARADWTKDEAAVASTLAGISKHLKNAQDAAFERAVQSGWRSLLTQTAPLTSLATSNAAPAASQLVTATLPTYKALVAKLNAWAAANDHWAAAMLSSNTGAYDSARTLGYLLLGLVLVLGAAIAYLVSASIKSRVDVVLERLRSLEEHCLTFVREGLEAFADGDLTRSYEPVTATIEHPSKDEIGQIATAVNGVRERTIASLEAYNASAARLRETVASVARTTGTVSATSQEMAATSEQSGRATNEIAEAVSSVAEGAERQVRMIAKARNSAEEVASATTQSAENAHRAVEVAQEALAAAREGVGAAEQVDDAMRSVRDSSEQVTLAIQDLASKSERIGAIVQTITGIAEQTNLLALNAAIEAARAGDHGRGFAVVAEEVRKLAEESQQAAQEISELVLAIQSGTSTAVSVVETGSRRTQDGTVVVEQSRDAFERIGTSVEDITARIEQIAAASQQIAANATTMTDAVTEAAAVAEESSASTEQVSAATQESSASAQQVAASAQALAGAAEELGAMLSRFNVGG
jgi:methyl-accepting chemotaxis protein